MKDDLLGAVSFLTIFGGGRSPGKSSKYWFSCAGIVIGFLSGLAWQLLGHTSSRLLGAALVVLVVVVITGAIHLDGLADAADGLLAHLERERRFGVMSSPEVGTFGIVAVVAALGLMTLAFSVLEPNVVLLIGIFSLSRELAALIMEVMPYAKSEGIVSVFNQSSGGQVKAKLILGAEMIVSCALIVLSFGSEGLVMVVVMFVVQGVIALRAKVLIGGYTGDVLGASIVATEILALVTGALMQR